jgi:hypothetical protein
MGSAIATSAEKITVINENMEKHADNITCFT